MKMSDQQPGNRSATLRHLREMVAARAENTSLRSVAREIGMSPTGLKKFLQGTAPYSPTLRRLRAWYVQYAAVPSGDVAFEDAQAAINVLVHDLPPVPRRRTVDRLMACLARGYDESGKSPPSWITQLRDPGEKAPPEADAPRERPSAFGKYRGVIGSSADYARSKHDDIDLEDRRPTWNTSSTRAR